MNTIWVGDEKFQIFEMMLEEMRVGEEGGEGMHVTWIFALQTQCEGCNESIYELLGGGNVRENMLRMWAWFLKLRPIENVPFASFATTALGST
jgi:hypothetical protein